MRERGVEILKQGQPNSLILERGREDEDMGQLMLRFGIDDLYADLYGGETEQIKGR